MRRGKLIGVGVGPGDPDLLTVKAVGVLKRATVIAFFAASGRASRAREIAAPHLPPNVRELVAVMPMGADAAATGNAYAQLASGIVGELGQGNDVAFLCEGDPLLYGSFVHLLARLGTRFEIESVPGISSLSAAAAASLTPLASREQPLAIIPATAPPKRIEGLLERVDRVVLLKVGRHLPRVREALGRARMLDEAVLVENVGTADQRIRPLREIGDEPVPYFSLVLAGKPAAKAAQPAVQRPAGDSRPQQRPPRRPPPRGRERGRA